MDGIGDLESLRAHFGAMATMVARKVMPRLDRHSRAFIALSPFLVLATADGNGGVDASPRGDAPGFVAMRDDTTLVIPDRPGNRRVDSFSNIIRQPGIGLIFFVPGFDETLRVNGTGRIVTDAPLLTPLEAQGKVPVTGALVSITEVFFHCGKALIRSKLWDPSRHVARDSLRSLGRIIAEQTAVMSAESAERYVATSYRERLY
jgi:PPOX class probable FMN-dependent enzyme